MKLIEILAEASNDKLDPWAEEMAKIIRTVVKNPDTSFGGMGSDGMFLSKAKTQKVIDAFIAAGYKKELQDGSNKVGEFFRSKMKAKCGVYFELDPFEEGSKEYCFIWEIDREK